MKSLIIVFAVLLVFSDASAQTPEKLKSNMIWLGIKTGFSKTRISGLDDWLATEGLSKTNKSSAGSGLLGFDLMYELGRIPIGLSPTFHLTGEDNQLTFLIDITLQSGYTIIKQDKINLKALGGIGLAYAGLNVNGTPKSFQTIAASYSNPYPRLSALNFRPSLMFSYTPFHLPNPDRKGSLHYQPIFYCQAGLNYFFNHQWKYGEVSNNSVSDDNSFSGVPVSMPNMLKSNLFISFGVAFAMQSK